MLLLDGPVVGPTILTIFPEPQAATNLKFRGSGAAVIPTTHNHESPFDKFMALSKVEGRFTSTAVLAWALGAEIEITLSA